MHIDHGARTDAGCVRTENQDRILAEPELGLFVVCDGMGGQRHGGEAAELACSAIHHYIERSHGRLDVTWPFGYNLEYSVNANRLITAIRLANRQVCRKAEQSTEHAGMGTTVAAVLTGDGPAVIAHVGDSRVYLCRDGSLAALTTDDTVAAVLVQQGVIQPAAADAHPMRRVLTQAAGSRDQIDVHVREEQLAGGDVLLICCDGVYNSVPFPTLQELVASGNPPVATAAAIIAAARDQGADDNISAVVIRCT